MSDPVAQSVGSLIADPGVVSSWRSIMKSFSKVILLLPLIQGGLLSVPSKSMSADYWLNT